MLRGDGYRRSSYHPNMPRKKQHPARVTGPDWYLREWMTTLEVRQTDLAELTGWSKATVSDIYHGRTNYYREMLNTIATALKIAPHELLMRPDDAMALRSLRGAAIQVVRSIPSDGEERTGTDG